MAAAFAAFATLAASCAHDRSKPTLGPPPALPDARRVGRAQPPPDWFWEPIAARVEGKVAPKIDRPTPEAAIVRVEGATRVWDEIGEDGRDRVRQRGVVVAEASQPAAVSPAIGAFYMKMRDERVPYVVTLDALFFAARVAIVRAVAEVEETSVVPGLEALLASLATRLGAEQRGATIEVADGLRVARGVVAVARALADPRTKIADDLAPAVAEELARVDAHAGVERSPLLGAPVDYAPLAAPPDVARPGAFKALAWLSAAPLSLLARFEAEGAPLDLATVRTQTRAAMLLARLVDHEVEPASHEAYARVAKLLAFVWGAPDDASLGDVLEIAAPLGVTLANAEDVANVAKVDRVRRRAAEVRAPHVFDGSAAPGRAGACVRLFGGSAPPDSRALAGTTGAPVGPARDGALRILPSTLDVATWLGAPQARAALHEAGADTYERFDVALARLPRPSEDDLHASLHGSTLAAIAAWLAVRGTSAEDRAAIESALAAWTWLRYDGRALARRVRDRPIAREPTELRVTGAPLPAFVEPAPEVIARLVGTVRQAQRGLATLGSLPSGSPALVGLADVEDLLRAALRVAEREVGDEALGPEDLAALASMPARLASIEIDMPVAVAAQIHTDLHGKTLVSATGPVEAAVRLAREPGTGRILLAVGAHVRQTERVVALSEEATAARAAPHPSAWTALFRPTRPAPPPPATR